jgi:uncharacterized protein YodC (DUF2158 family)
MGMVEKLEPKKISEDQFFRVGAIVRLNSGSPPLTIMWMPAEPNEVDAIWVRWFDGTAYRDADFPRACLTWRPDDNGAVAVPE